jgi:polyphosphate kinase 2 (PPK2 family)
MDSYALVASTKGTRVMEKRVTKILDRYRVTKGRGFRLKDYDPGDTAGLDMEKTTAGALLQQGIERLALLQDKLYAQDRWSVLCIFQAMDAAGKDGVIKHVFSGVNPQGCQVHSFKAPGAMELDHDFLWRHSIALPERGRIGIHNRSWYEEALVLRVHPEFLARQKLPPSLIGKKIWDERLEDIAAYERYLARQGDIIRASLGIHVGDLDFIKIGDGLLNILNSNLSTAHSKQISQSLARHINTDATSVKG